MKTAFKPYKGKDLSPEDIQGHDGLLAYRITDGIELKKVNSLYIVYQNKKSTLKTTAIDKAVEYYNSLIH